MDDRAEPLNRIGPKEDRRALARKPAPVVVLRATVRASRSFPRRAAALAFHPREDLRSVACRTCPICSPFSDTHAITYEFRPVDGAMNCSRDTNRPRQAARDRAEKAGPDSLVDHPRPVRRFLRPVKPLPPCGVMGRPIAPWREG